MCQVCPLVQEVAPAEYVKKAFNAKYLAVVVHVLIRRIWSFYVVVSQRTAKKCTKIQNVQGNGNCPLFCSLSLLFGDVLVHVAVVVCLSSLHSLCKDEGFLFTLNSKRTKPAWLVAPYRAQSVSGNGRQKYESCSCHAHKRGQ